MRQGYYASIQIGCETMGGDTLAKMYETNKQLRSVGYVKKTFDNLIANTTPPSAISGVGTGPCPVGSQGVSGLPGNGNVFDPTIPPPYPSLPLPSSSANAVPSSPITSVTNSSLSNFTVCNSWGEVVWDAGRVEKTKCNFCTNGYIELFTSRSKCDKCGGTGYA